MKFTGKKETEKQDKNKTKTKTTKIKTRQKQKLKKKTKLPKEAKVISDLNGSLGSRHFLPL